MPTRRVKRTRRRQANGRGGANIAYSSANANGIISGRFTAFTFATAGTTPTNLSVSKVATSGLSSRLTAFAGVYSLCRCVGIRLRFSATPSNAGVVVAFHPANNINTPTSLTNLLEYSNVGMTFPGVTVPTSMSVGRNELLETPSKWYYVTDTESGSQGLFWFAAYGETAAFVVQWEFHFEFTSPSADGQQVTRSLGTLACKSIDDEKRDDQGPPPPPALCARRPLQLYGRPFPP